MGASSAILALMDDASRSRSSRRERSTAGRVTDNGQVSQNLAPRSGAAAIVDKPVSNGAQNDARSLARRSFDELMESRSAESGAVWRAFLGPLLSQTEVQQMIGADSANEVDALVAEQRLLAL